MRKLFILALTLGIATNCFAVVKKPGHRRPESNRPQYVEPRESRPHLGWYIAPALKIGEINQEMRTLVGVRGGLEFNRSFYVGLAGYGLSNDNAHNHWAYDRYGNCDPEYQWELGYGGLEFGVITGTPRRGQVSLGALIGGGSTNERRFWDREDKGFFVFEPQLDFTVNLTRNVRLCIGGSYRFIDNLHSERYTKEDLEGPAVNFAIAFGIF